MTDDLSPLARRRLDRRRLLELGAAGIGATILSACGPPSVNSPGAAPTTASSAPAAGAAPTAAATTAAAAAPAAPAANTGATVSQPVTL
ncbi:MAG TPA: hypothetical protein VFZ25_17315, partial [Chloroflexota bacterium]|nr:hypothetical protein [Chloroflexota bacterium]